MGAEIIVDELSELLKQTKKALSPAGRVKMLKEINQQMIGDNTRLFNKESYADAQGNEKKWLSWNKGKGHIKPGTTKYADGTWKLIHSARVSISVDADRGKFRSGSASHLKGRHKGKLSLKHGTGERYSVSSKLLADTGNLRNSIGSTSKGINRTTSLFTEIGTKVKYAAKQDKLRPLISVSTASFKKIYNIIYRNMGVTK